MKLLAILVLALLPHSVFADDFGNWYFKFHAQKIEISGVISSPDGVECFHELIVKAENRYRLKTTFPDGTIVESSGSLGKDGVITATDVATNKEGQKLSTMKYQRSVVTEAEKAPKD